MAVGGSGQKRVAIFGDSLTYQATDNLVRAFAAPGIDGDVFGITGIQVRDALHPVIEDLENEPDAVVIALGINDLLFSGDPWFIIKRDIDEMIDTLQEVSCAVWVAPAMASKNPDVDRMSEYLHSLADDQLHVLDWDKLADSADDTYGEDGVHHTEVGQKRFADAVRDAVKDDCGI